MASFECKVCGGVTHRTEECPSKKIPKLTQQITNPYTVFFGFTEYVHLTSLPEVKDDLKLYSNTLKSCFGIDKIDYENDLSTPFNKRDVIDAREYIISDYKQQSSRSINPKDGLIILMSGHGGSSNGSDHVICSDCDHTWQTDRCLKIDDLLKPFRDPNEVGEAANSFRWVLCDMCRSEDNDFQQEPDLEHSEIGHECILFSCMPLKKSGFARKASVLVNAVCRVLLFNKLQFKTIASIVAETGLDMQNDSGHDQTLQVKSVPKYNVIIMPKWVNFNYDHVNTPPNLKIIFKSNSIILQPREVGNTILNKFVFVYGNNQKSLQYFVLNHQSQFVIIHSSNNQQIIENASREANHTLWDVDIINNINQCNTVQIRDQNGKRLIYKIQLQSNFNYKVIACDTSLQVYNLADNDVPIPSLEPETDTDSGATTQDDSDSTTEDSASTTEDSDNGANDTVPQDGAMMVSHNSSNNNDINAINDIEQRTMEQEHKMMSPPSGSNVTKRINVKREKRPSVKPKQPFEIFSNNNNNNDEISVPPSYPKNTILDAGYYDSRPHISVPNISNNNNVSIMSISNINNNNVSMISNMSISNINNNNNNNNAINESYQSLPNPNNNYNNNNNNEISVPSQPYPSQMRSKYESPELYDAQREFNTSSNKQFEQQYRVRSNNNNNNNNTMSMSESQNSPIPSKKYGPPKKYGPISMEYGYNIQRNNNNKPQLSFTFTSQLPSPMIGNLTTSQLSYYSGDAMNTNNQRPIKRETETEVKHFGIDDDDDATNTNESDPSKHYSKWLKKSKEKFYPKELQQTTLRVNGCCDLVNAAKRKLDVEFNFSNDLPLFDVSTVNIETHCAWFKEYPGLDRGKLKRPIISAKIYQDKVEQYMKNQRPKEFAQYLYSQLLELIHIYAQEISGKVFMDSGELENGYYNLLMSTFIFELFNKEIQIPQTRYKIIVILGQSFKLKNTSLKSALAKYLCVNATQVSNFKIAKDCVEQIMNKSSMLLKGLLQK